MNLSTVVSHVKDIPNEFNKTSILEFYEYMRETDKSPNTQKQMLIALTGFARHLGELRYYRERRSKSISGYEN